MDEGILLDPEIKKIFIVNEIAARVWGLMDGRRTIHEIVRELEDKYDVDRARLERDVTAFLEELAAHGLVRPTSGSGEESPDE